MTGKTLLLGAAVVIGVAVLYVNRRASRTEVAAHSAIASTAKVGRASVPELVQLPPPAHGLAEATKSVPAAAERPTKLREPAQPQPGEGPIERFAPAHEVLEAAFVSEPRDGAWAMEAQRTADTALSAALPARSVIKSIDCRSTLCRIESTHDGYRHAKEFVNQLARPEGRPWNGGFYTGAVSEEAGTGAVTFITYLAREGAQVPSIPDRSSEEQAAR